MATTAVAGSDFAGLRNLEECAGDDFVGGVVLYSGRQTVAFGERLWAVPLSALWSKA